MTDCSNIFSFLFFSFASFLLNTDSILAWNERERLETEKKSPKKWKIAKKATHEKAKIDYDYVYNISDANQIPYKCKCISLWQCLITAAAAALQCVVCAE